MRDQVHTSVMQRVNALFDVPIIQNNLRGIYMELFIAELLGDGWKAVSGDWAAWDIEHEDGTRLEVKQSAAKQTWAAPETGVTAPVFSIRKPKFTWAGAVRTVATGRPAHIYVFAWHDNASEAADQRKSEQWQFFVTPAPLLPDQKTIGLNSLKKIAISINALELNPVVENLRIEGVLQ